MDLFQVLLWLWGNMGDLIHLNINKWMLDGWNGVKRISWCLTLGPITFFTRLPERCPMQFMFWGNDLLQFWLSICTINQYFVEMCNVLSWIIVKNCIGACIRNCFMFKVGLGSLHTQVTNDWPGPKNSQVSKLLAILFCSFFAIYWFMDSKWM